MAQALLVVDVLTGIFELPVPLHEPAAFVERVADLLARARQAGVVIAHVQQLGAEGSRFAPGGPTRAFHAAAAPLAGELVIEKGHPDAFHGTTVASVLRERGVTSLAICGFASEFCVDASVRGAYANGFAVELAADAHTTTRGAVLEAREAVAHHNWVLASFARVVPAADVAFTAA
ncbi:MAG: isochorismatase family protein [Kofleriaceae bacterium]